MHKFFNLSRRTLKVATLRYIFVNPALLLTIFKNFRQFYFLNRFEIFKKEPFNQCLYSFLPEEFLKQINIKEFYDFRGRLLVLYWIAREFKPEIVVETGVARGDSSAFILCAMHENGKGHLYSIDLPPYEAYIQKNDNYLLLKDGQKHKNTQNYQVGELVPEYLKDRWTLVQGDSKKELPKILKDLKEITIFLHDSLHTYEHMMFEYEAAWPHIINGGFLLSHDVIWNNAFIDFSKKIKSKPILYYSTGIIKKQ